MRFYEKGDALVGGFGEPNLARDSGDVKRVSDHTIRCASRESLLMLGIVYQNAQGK